MGGISFSRNGINTHITADGQYMSEKMATNCDSCFEPFDRMQMHSIADARLMICQICYLKHIRK